MKKQLNQMTNPSRREFLGTSLAVSAAVTVMTPSVFAKDDASQVTSLKGRVYKAVKGGQKNGESAEDFFNRLKELGFHGAESGNPAKGDEYRAAKDKTGIMIHGLVNNTHWKVRMSDPDPEVREQAKKNLESVIINSWKLGGSSVLLVPGRVGGEKETHDDVWHRSAEQIRRVLPLASQLGQRILIETVWNGFCYDPEKFRDYIDLFDSPWVGAYFDIGNMQKFAPAHEWIRILGQRTVKLDVKDWGVKNGFCRLGEGDVDWDKCRDELIKLNFTGWATREGRDKDLADTSKLMDDLLVH
jgi:L-ribulose-5-phosphate 3-epimerase